MNWKKKSEKHKDKRKNYTVKRWQKKWSIGLVSYVIRVVDFQIMLAHDQCVWKNVDEHHRHASRLGHQRVDLIIHVAAQAWVAPI